VVTVWDPPRRLAYTWSEDSTNSEVSFELSLVDGSVRLVLTHRSMPLGHEIGLGGGWHACLDALGLALDGADPAAVKAAWNGSPDLDAPYTAAFEAVRAQAALTPADDLRAVFEASAWNRHVGFELIEISQERLSARVQVRPELIGGRGTLHGGVVAALVDSIGAFQAAIAAQRHIRTKGGPHDDKRPFRVAAIDHHVDYLRPLLGPSFTASTAVLQVGDHIVRVRVEVVDAKGERVATASVNFAY
jgi:uncharacterized protein (TIGR00369 family)